MVIHIGIVATMFARYPKIIDFSCGFQSYLPSGACSRAWRERSTSRSNSASRNSVSFILVSLSYPQIRQRLCRQVITAKSREQRAKRVADERVPDGPQINADWRGYDQTRNGECYGGRIRETNSAARPR